MNKRPSYRVLLSWILLLLYFLGATRIIHPYLEYKINYDCISEVLCVNKSKPALQCHGKCYLAKEVKKVATEKKEIAANQTIESVPGQSIEPAFDKSLVYVLELNVQSTFHSMPSAQFEHLTPPPQA